MTEEPSDQPESAIGFEEALARLEEIVHELEEGEVPLAEAISRYEAGIRLLKRCHGLLATAEQKIQRLTEVNEQGQPTAEPFSAEATTLDKKETSRSRRRSRSDDA